MQIIEETSIKICNVSDDDIGNQHHDDDDDDLAGAVGPAPGAMSSAHSQPQYPHLHQYHQPHSPPVDQHHFPTATTSPPTSADGLPRTSKHSRTRAPVHQSKAAPKMDADMLLMETSLVYINQSPSPILPTVHQPHQHQHQHLPPPHSKPSSPTAVLIEPSSTSTSPHQPPPTLPGALTSPVQTPMAKHYQQIKEHQELVQKLAEQHQKHVKPTSPPQSTTSHRAAVGHFMPRSQHHHRPHPLVMPTSSSNSNELELVLSPSKLGQ